MYREVGEVRQGPRRQEVIDERQRRLKTASERRVVAVPINGLSQTRR